MYNDRKRSYWGTFLVALITSLGVGAFLLFAFSGTATNNRRNTEIPQTPINNADGQPQPQQLAAQMSVVTSDSADIAKTASPSVVGISVLKVGDGHLFEGNAQDDWGVGSGVIVSGDGYILTNNHVAGGRNKRIIVSLHDGRNVDGVTVWADPVLDLAVVKVNAPNLKVMAMGDSNQIQVGEPVLAIGNPLGLQFQRTVTSGIISALNRTIRIDTAEGPNYMEDLVQTDASINPGNSGGPLINLRGQLIGINTLKITTAEGIGFAVPINIAIPIIRRLAEKGEFIEPYMGVFAYDRDVMKYMSNNINLQNGIYVAHVDNGGPANKVGIKVGCIITQVDGKPVNTMMQLRTYMYSKQPGDVVHITHIDNGAERKVDITLAAKVKDGTITR